MNKYNTNTKKLTCSCLDWIESRQYYSLNDPRRLCKHLINKLDIDNLPIDIFKFKEDLLYYQEKGWGFKKSFDEMIELDSFTLLGTFDWIDVYDENAVKYSLKKEAFSNEIFWAKNKKPENYLVIERFFNKEKEKKPLFLEKEEHKIIIDFIKKVLPHKKDYHLKIEISQFLPNEDGIIYDIWETKLTPEEESKLMEELLKKYDKDEAYCKLGEINFNLDEDEFCIYTPLVVSNDLITINMYSGKDFKLVRDYAYVKQIKEDRELKEKIEKEKEEKVWKEKLDKRRKIAKTKGVGLTEDYKGSLYFIQNFYNFPEHSSWDILINSRYNALKEYDTLNNLIKANYLNLSTTIFNKILVELDFLIKDPNLNLNDWILKGKGLEYGINYIKESKYMHYSIPQWYKTHIFNFQILKLINFEFYENIKMTKVLFKKEKFRDLCLIVNEYIKNRPKKEISKPKIVSKKQLDREKWLRHITCPKCGEETNIHKKDIRKRSEYSVQRFYCNECKSLFQIRVDELEKLINDYEEKILDSNKNNLGV